MRRALLILLAPFSMLAAQDPMGAPARAAMDKLSFLEGEWRGPAWYQMGPTRSTADQYEKIYRAAGGTVLVVEGHGTSTDPGSQGRAVHEAFAVIYWDMQTQKYVFRSHVANGYSIQTTPELGDKMIAWTIQVPGARMRYTMSVTPAGDWSEIGERSTDEGKTWTRFMEMTLKRVK
jgi:hypothetical protein